jgi:tetratricopeptide (TPR) repeat protein
VGSFNPVTMLRRYVVIVLAIFYIPTYAQHLTLSTASDSALHYYYEGWRLVMEEGNYTASEKAFRKMMTYDQNFLVGMAQVGRITRNLQERLDIEVEIEKHKSQIPGDELLLLDNYLALVTLTNLRETAPEAARIQVKSIFQSSERNLRTIVHRYPDEIYYRAEYIEVLHYNYGAARALDSLYTLFNKKQQQNAFIVGYAALLEAELGKFEHALIKADELSQTFARTEAPKPFVVYADIYFKMRKLKEAQTQITKALALDSGNIDAQRLEKKITEALKENKR